MRVYCSLLASLLTCATIASQPPPLVFNGGTNSLAPRRILAAEKQETRIKDLDESFLKEHGVGTDDRALLEYLRERSKADDDLLKIDQLIRQLGDRQFPNREEAQRRLSAVGLVAMPALRAALKNPDQEIVRRATACIQWITKEANWAPPLAAVRLLSFRRPAGAAEVLLRYLPYVNDETSEEVIWFALSAMADADEKVRKLLVPALKDPLPARRALAACVLGRLGNANEITAVKKLLSDAEPVVRLRAAQGLLAGNDKQGLPVLVALLEEAPTYLAWQAEELLTWAAGDGGPEIALEAGSPQRRKQAREGWSAWLRDNEAKIDLAKTRQEPRRPGLILITGETGVWLCGCNGKPRWKLAIDGGLADFQLLPSDRILLAEIDGRAADRVRERDLQGKVLWEKEAPQRGLVHCYRLPNGSTFIATMFALVETAWDDSATYSHDLTKLDVTSIDGARRTPNGHVFCMNSLDRGIIVLHCVTGRNLGKVPGKLEGKRGYDVQPLAGNHYLFAIPDLDEVREIDGSGKTVWRHPQPGASWAHRLPGDTLLVRVRRGDTERVVEIDRNGTLLWELQNKAGIGSVRPCLGLVRVGFTQPRPAGVSLDAVSHWTRLAGHKDVQVRLRVVEALDKLAAKSDVAASTLVELLTDPDEHVQFSAARAVERVGVKALPALNRALQDDRPALRATVARIMGVFSFRENMTVAESLIRALRDGDWQVRSNAVESLRWAGRSHGAAVTHISALTNDKNRMVRKNAVDSLGFFPWDAKAIVPLLVALLSDKDSDLAATAIGSLGRIGNGASDAVPALAELVKSRKKPLCQPAITALGSIGRQAKAAVPALVQALDEKDYRECRTEILLALGSIGPEAQEATPKLISILKDEDSTVRRLAATALGRIGPAAKDAVPELAKALRESRDPNLQLEAAVALGRMGKAASAAEPDLKEAAKDPGQLGDAASRSLRLISSR
ncbi:MAG: HEAT repeat domain-containing protein [Gemmataceae bacterium]|nr:HEAT repeat domain-containing protein [Gemmataceae bacterium]